MLQITYAVRSFLESIRFIDLINLFQLLLVAFSIIIRLIYSICVYTDGKNFDAAHRSVLVSLFRSGFWFGFGFKIILWLIGDSNTRSLLIHENYAEALLLFVLGIVSYILGMFALLRKKHTQRLFISNNLLKTGNINLLLSIILTVLAWVLE